MKTITLQSLVWDYSDLLEVLRKGHLLVVVDYYFKWPEVAFLSMESMFCTHGLSETLWSNNGPPLFCFTRLWRIPWVPSYWPQSDGEVERLNKTLLKAIRIAELEGKDWKQELQDQYCNTPHTVTSLSPAELLMGRKLRDKLLRVRAPLLIMHAKPGASATAGKVRTQKAKRERICRLKEAYIYKWQRRGRHGPVTSKLRKQAVIDVCARGQTKWLRRMAMQWSSNMQLAKAKCGTLVIWRSLWNQVAVGQRGKWSIWGVNDGLLWQAPSNWGSHWCEPNQTWGNTSQ